ncbi:MAG: hypothetical protein JWO04_1771 [Gammaproteobacteria bacterium]|nr:hypothetical protein [Gammaproteobacteria bacterium]
MSADDQTSAGTVGLPSPASKPSPVTKWTVGSLPAGKLAWVLGVILIGAHVAVLSRLSSMPFQDAPNHLARAVAMADLMFHDGTRFGGVFQYHFLAVPYVLGDLILATAVELFGHRGGNALWMTLVLLSLPCAMLFYLRVAGIAADARAMFLVVSMFLATDWFFLMGFFEFRLAIAMTLLIFALAQLLRRSWSLGLFVAYGGAVVLGYLTHLSTLIFAAATIGASGLLRLLLRTSSLRREAGLLAPIIAVSLWHFGVVVHYRAAGDVAAAVYKYDTPHGKAVRLGWEFFRFHRSLDGLILVLLAACVIWPARRRLRLSELKAPAVLEMFLLAAVFLGMYLVLPVATADAYYIDVRPLALVSLFGVIAILCLWEEGSLGRSFGSALTLPLAALLVMGNLAYLARHLYREDGSLTQVRDLLGAVPRGAYVLFGHTRDGTDWMMKPFQHADAYVVADRGGVIPSLFSGDGGNPMKYFRYIHRPYTPPEDWYVDWPRPRVQWQQVACTYDFILVSKPFEQQRIGVATTTVAENESAALLSTDKGSCRVGATRAAANSSRN